MFLDLELIMNTQATPPTTPVSPVMTVSPAWLNTLQELSGTSAGPLSPLFTPSPIVSARPSGAELQTAGVTDAAGRVLPMALRTLHTLSGAVRVVRVRVVGAAVRSEFSVYTDATGRTASVSGGSQALYLNPEPAVGDFLNMVRELTGESSLSAGSGEWELPERLAMCLLGLIDQQRRHSLRLLSEGNEPSALVHTNYPAFSELGTVFADAQSLQARLQRMSGGTRLPLTMTDDEVRALESAQCFIKEGEGFALSGDILLLAGRMLILENVIEVEMVGQTPGGAPVRTRSNLIQSGAQDVLFMEAGNGTVHLQIFSARALMRYLEIMLLTPEKVLALEPTPPPIPGAAMPPPLPNVCPQCGAAYTPPAKFCSACGSKV